MCGKETMEKKLGYESLAAIKKFPRGMQNISWTQHLSNKEVFDLALYRTLSENRSR